MYLTIKTLHMVFILLSFTGFLLRSYWMLTDSRLLNHKATIILPHVIDAIFLSCGFYLAFMVNFGLFTQFWLTSKIFLYMFYLLFVGIALNRGTTKRVRTLCFFLALLTFGYIVGIAINKSPASWFAM